MSKTISFEEFLTLKIDLSTYDVNRIEETKKLCLEVNKFYPAGIIIDVSEQEGNFCFEHCGVKLEHPFLNMSVSFNTHKKQYNFTCRSLYHLHTDNYRHHRATKHLIPPNNVGILSTAKINAWVAFYEQVLTLLEEVDEQNRKMKADFLESLKPYKVTWYEENSKGYITRGGLQFYFTIEKTHIHTEIKVAYRQKDDLNIFIKMSDNKLNQQQ